MLYQRYSGAATTDEKGNLWVIGGYVVRTMTLLTEYRAKISLALPPPPVVSFVKKCATQFFIAKKDNFIMFYPLCHQETRDYCVNDVS